MFTLCAPGVGFACMFSRKGDTPVAFPMRCLVLTHVGFVHLANEVLAPTSQPSRVSIEATDRRLLCDSCEQFAREQGESTVFVIEGLVYTIMAMHAASPKRTKESAVVWQQTLTGKPTTTDASATKEDEEAKTATLSPAAFKLLLDDMFGSRSLSRRVQTMAIVLLHVEGLYTGNAPPGRDSSPNQTLLSALSLYDRIAERLYHSGTLPLLRDALTRCSVSQLTLPLAGCCAGVKILFGIFDRTAAEEGDCYDEEIEFHLLLALTELFFQFFAPFAHQIVDDTAAAAETPAPLSATAAFERATARIKQLWPLLEAGMRGIDDSVSSPQRFSLVLHVVQVFAQVEASLRADEAATVAKLHRVRCACCYSHRLNTLTLSLTLSLSLSLFPSDSEAVCSRGSEEEAHGPRHCEPSVLAPDARTRAVAAADVCRPRRAACR